MQCINQTVKDYTANTYTTEEDRSSIWQWSSHGSTQHTRTWSLGRSTSGTLACSGVEDMSRCDEDSKILLLLLPVSAKLHGRGSQVQLVTLPQCMHDPFS